MIKVKKPLDKTNYNLGYKIVEVSQELADSQFSKSDAKRNTQWRGVEIATEGDVVKWGKAGETLNAPLKVEVEFSESVKKQIEEAAQMAEMAMAENEQFKKEIAELKAKKQPKTEATV